MTSILTGIGCIVVVLILMIPPFLFGYALYGDGNEDLAKLMATLCLIEFVALTSGLVWCVNGGVFG